MAIDEVQAIWFVIALVIFFLLLPPNWDPAIKLKELTEAKDGRLEPSSIKHKGHWLFLLWRILRNKL